MLGSSQTLSTGLPASPSLRDVCSAARPMPQTIWWREKQKTTLIPSSFFSLGKLCRGMWAKPNVEFSD